MKSIKPGRGPSMMSGVVGILMMCFGIGWTIIAAFAFWPMAIFGLIWTGIVAVSTIYDFKNATGKNRYSQFDIVDSNEEPDPFNERFGNKETNDDTKKVDEDSNFCPYCGTAVDKDFEYCNKCGKKLP